MLSNAGALLVTIALLGAITATLAPTATAAATYPFGTVVDKPDYDYTPVAKAIAPATLCMFDPDANAFYSPGEALFIHLAPDCTGMVGFEDIRVLPEMGLDPEMGPGTEVAVEDADYARLLAPVPDHALRYVDIAAKGKYDKKSPLYLDLMHVGALKVNPGDVRLTKYGELPAGSIVQLGDPDVNFPLTDLKGGKTQIGDANVLYEAGKGKYINTDKGEIGTKDLLVEDKDVRIVADVPDPMGELYAMLEAMRDVRPGVEGSAHVVPTAVSGPDVAVTTGSTFQVSVTVANQGDAPGAGLVTTRLDGAVVDARGTPTLAPGATATMVVTLVAAPGAATFRAVTVDGLEGSLNVPVAAGAASTDSTLITELEARIDALDRQLRAAQHGSLAVQGVTFRLDARVDALEADKGTDDDPAQTSIAGEGSPGMANVPGPAPSLVVALVALGAVAFGARDRRP